MQHDSLASLAGQIKVNALKVDLERGFTLKGHEKNPRAPRSPFYLDYSVLHELPLEHELLRNLARQLYKLIERRRIRFDCFAGIPNDGVPIAKALAAYYLSKHNKVVPLLPLIKEETPSGRRIARVGETSIPRGALVLLIDDVATGGNSGTEALDTLRLASYEVKDLLVTVDRQQGAREHLLKSRVALHSIFGIYDFFSTLRYHHRLSRETHHAVLKYLATA